MVTDKRIKMVDKHDSQTHAPVKGSHVQDPIVADKGSKQDNVLTERDKVTGQGHKRVRKKVHQRKQQEEEPN
jgi:hypothetical protein